MKKIIFSFCMALIAMVSFAQDAATWKSLEKPLNFYLANDLGRNGYYDQKPIAGAQCARPFVDDQLRTDIQPSRFDVALVSHFRES